ncbi:uncharacterized protein [Rutidosis leptorrhynchoides]|uniref:uncharacterized protein isoform X2 n=1 Tax=Rutidosis leptorrhynchoides TaxID=125765 RepID=UPI003A98E394
MAERSTREAEAHWKIVRFYRRQLIDRKGIVRRCLELILFKRALIAGFQGVTWIFLNCQPMVTFAEGKILEDVVCNDHTSKYVPIVFVFTSHNSDIYVYNN